MRIKPGVGLLGIKPEMVAAFPVIDAVYYEISGHDALLTSGTEGLHGARSLHYRGFATDWRVKDVDENQWAPLRDALQEALGGVGGEFDVILELHRRGHEHIHIEWDPVHGREV